jgi:competence protein ComGC
MTINYSKLNKGFSVMEMIIYISILTVLIVIVMNILISINRSEKIIRATKNIQTSGVSTLERITREVRSASDIDSLGSVFDVHPSRLSLVRTNPAGSVVRTVEFFLDSGSLRVRENGVDLGALSDQSVEITNLVFRQFMNDNSKGVRIELTLKSGAGSAERSLTLYATGIIRKSF